MRKIIPVVASSLLLILTACVTRYEQPRYVVAPPPPPPPSIPAMPQAQPAPAFAGSRECREFQQTIVVNGQEQPGYGKACRQPDGTWKIVE